jgi:hypothetical protein
MQYKIVVARYNENIEWLKSEMNNCIIYNKGNKLNLPNEVMLENVGRESETYLNFIINNYDNLPDIVVFTQANISDHKGSNNILHLIKLKKEAELNSKSLQLKTHYDGTSEFWWDKDWNVKDPNFLSKNNYKNNRHMLFMDWFKENIDINYPNPIHIYPNAIFAVKKELILNKPLEYYKKLILEVNHHINPVEGHFFERSWYYIFNIQI